jgi:hypothetical protein
MSSHPRRSKSKSVLGTRSKATPLSPKLNIIAGPAYGTSIGRLHNTIVKTGIESIDNGDDDYQDHLTQPTPMGNHSATISPTNTRKN